MSRLSDSDGGEKVDPTRRRVLRTTAATGLGSVVFAGTAAADDVTDPVFEDGRAQPVYADDEVIREDVWVETETDTDETGEPDRVHVEIARPSSTQNGDLELPVIAEPSPYYGGLRSYDSYDMADELYAPDKPGRDLRDPGEGTIETDAMSEEDLIEFTGSDGPGIGPSPFEDEFLPRGFIFAYAASIGTEQSTGCPTVGGPAEVESIKSVVDWLNGRADAYDSPVGGLPVDADWTTGRTGMIGASYNGTLPNGVAATGVDGLEAIVPGVAISSWYTYYRSHGTPIATGPTDGPAMDTDILFDAIITRDDPEVCDHVRESLTEGQDRLTGNYNEFWAERDYVPAADNVDAAVLVTHGLFDDNVKTRNFSRWYAALKEHDVAHKIVLHQGGHGWPAFEDWFDLLNRWWTHWLFGVDTDVMDEPVATVEREDGSWAEYAEWPDPDAESVPVALQPGGPSIGGLTTGQPTGQPVEETLVDDPSIPTADLAAATESEHRLAYRTEPLEEAVRVSGTVRPDLRLSFDSDAALVSALLVDYAPDGDVEIVNRGWADPQNRKSLSETFALNPPERPYRLEFPLQAVDRVFDEGHRLGIVVYSSDFDFTKRPSHEPELRLDVTSSAVNLPIVGGQSAFDDALSN